MYKRSLTLSLLGAALLVSSKQLTAQEITLPDEQRKLKTPHKHSFAEQRLRDKQRKLEHKSRRR